MSSKFFESDIVLNNIQGKLIFKYTEEDGNIIYEVYYLINNKKYIIKGKVKKHISKTHLKNITKKLTLKLKEILC